MSWKCKSRTIPKRRSNCIGLSKMANSCTKASGSPRTKFNRSFLIAWRNSTQWGPFLPKGGGMIQVDIGGHPPITLGAPPLSLSVFQKLLFLAFFRVLNFQKRFEAPNGDSMPQLHPREVEMLIYPNGAHIFGASSPRVRFWTCRVLHYFSIINRPLSCIVTQFRDL